jgi:hypothetical protein
VVRRQAAVEGGQPLQQQRRSEIPALKDLRFSGSYGRTPNARRLTSRPTSGHS